MPTWAAFSAFFFTIGMMTLIRVILEHELYFSRWTAFWLGDTIAIPLFAYFASYGLQEYHSAERWYDSKEILYVLALCGVLIGLALFNGAVNNRGVTWRYLLERPSELYHTFVIWPLLTAMVAKSIFLLIATRSTERSQFALKGVACAILLYVGFLVYDAKWLPGRNDPGI